MAFNKKTHLRQNIDALKTAFTLDRERRAPTPEEERTLGAYSGFGAIKEVLENPTGKPDKDGMATLVAELQEVIRPDGFLHAPESGRRHRGGDMGHADRPQTYS